jgi:NAD(P)-dependent dehydrogenase (short-subunit alcohol dehydrogenase family)
MRVFVTCATGFIGSAVVPELINAGHQVLGLARSDEGAKSLIAAGAEVHRGDLEGLCSGAAMSEPSFTRLLITTSRNTVANCEADRKAIEALGAGLAGSGHSGSDRPLIVTSGIGPSAPGQLRTEEDPPVSSSVSPAARRKRPRPP